MWLWVFQMVWWLAIAGVTGAAYYYYVQPYVAKIERLYGLSEEQSKSWNDQVTNFLKFFGQQGQKESPKPSSVPVTATTTVR